MTETKYPLCMCLFPWKRWCKAQFSFSVVCVSDIVADDIMFRFWVRDLIAPQLRASFMLVPSRFVPRVLLLTSWFDSDFKSPELGSSFCIECSSHITSLRSLLKYLQTRQLFSDHAFLYSRHCLCSSKYQLPKLYLYPLNTF